MDINKSFKCCCLRKSVDTSTKENIAEYNISNISKKTSCEQVQHENNNPKHYGTNSPHKQAEEERMALCTKMGKFWQALSTKKDIELMNTSICGIHIQNDVAKFQIEQKLSRQDFS